MRVVWHSGALGKLLHVNMLMAFVANGSSSGDAGCESLGTVEALLCEQPSEAIMLTKPIQTDRVNDHRFHITNR
jgi:hypothetical protein